MFKVKKRKEGKFKTDNSLKEFYQEYTRQADNRQRLSYNYNIYSEVLREFNLLVIKNVIEEARTLKLPYNLGYIGIIKYEVNFDPAKINTWKVNYAKSKELGHIVYHEEPFRYRWYWDKHSVKLKGKRFYKFIPSRFAQRQIKANKLNNPKMDYYTKLSISEDGK